MESGIYFALYSILSQYFYGAGTVLTEHMELTLTLISTIGCLFVFALPFLVVWRIIKLFV